MRRIGIGTLALLSFVVDGALLGSPLPARAQIEEGGGWIEGVLVNDKGIPTSAGLAYHGMSYDPARIALRPQVGQEISTTNDRSRGGYYTFRNLKPGVYEVFVDASVFHSKANEEDVRYRPQHIFGIVVEPNKRTVLNITVHKGIELEEIGKPVIATEEAVNLAVELTRLRKEVEELKKQVAELKEKR